MRLDDLVGQLDAYFRTADVRGDDWAPEFASLYPDPYWRPYAEPGYEGRWNGLMVRGASDVERVVTCVFPSDAVVAGLSPRTLLFSEHPIDLADEPGFLPLARTTFEAMHAGGISFYHVHAPLDMHPEISPSRLLARAIGLAGLEEYYPIAEGISGGAAVIGNADVRIDELVARVGTAVGPEVPVSIVERFRDRTRRVAVVGGGGADEDMLRASLERGCDTYVTGGVVTRCRLDFVQEGVRRFLAAARDARVSVIDGTHYGTEKLPQLAMLDWFRARGLEAVFAPGEP